MAPNRALADGLEPGLRQLIQAATEFLAENQDMVIVSSGGVFKSHGYLDGQNARRWDEYRRGTAASDEVAMARRVRGDWGAAPKRACKTAEQARKARA